MKCFSVLLFCFLSFAVSSEGQVEERSNVYRLPEAEAAKTISLNPDFLVFGEALATGEEKLPLLIVLHGGGDPGMDIEKIRGFSNRFARAVAQAGIEAIVVGPQASKSPAKEGAKGGWIPADLDVLLDQLLKTFPADPERVYLTGNSMGGYGTYAWAGVNPGRFAAIAPTVGGLGALGPKDITPDLDLWGKNLATLPMKTYYGALDKIVPAERGEMILKAIKNAGGTKAELIVYDDLGHDAARRPYSDPEFYLWLFSHRRTGK